MPASTQAETSRPPAPPLAIVTGAASGLGRAFCLRLAADRRPHHVIAIDVDELGGDETAGQMRQICPGASIEFLALDVTDASAWRELAGRLEQRLAVGEFSQLALLVNNAGVCASGEVAGGDAAPWRRLMDVNFFGALHACQALAPLMDARGDVRPRIINVGSIAGVLSAPAMGAYNASKAAVISLSETLSAELRPRGVGVTVVAPGFFRTKLLVSGAFAEREHRLQAEKLMRSAQITADGVATAALAGSERGRLYVVLGRRARWLWRLKRWAPTTLHRLIALKYKPAVTRDQVDPDVATSPVAEDCSAT